MNTATPSRRRGLDILGGSIWKGVPLFALPVAATSILEQLSNLIGVVMIGNFSGSEAAGALGMAAVGSNTPISSLILNLFIGMSLGATVVIANAVGRGDTRLVNRTAHTSVAMAALGVVVVVVCELVAEPVLVLLNVPPETLPEALLYLRVYLLGMPSILLYNFEAAVFRGIGVTKMPLQALALSSVLNVVLDLLFIPVFGWGVAGCALATVLSYTTSATVLLVRLVRARDEKIRVCLREVRLHADVLRRVVRIGLPAGVQSAVFAFANIVIQACINSLGTEVMAASSAAMSLEYVCYNLLNSFSQACTTFVGQNNGAGQIGRCKKALLVCLVEDGLVDVVMISLMLVFGSQILALFNPDPEVVRIGYLRVATIFPAYAFSMVYENMSGYLRGFGISLLPAVLTTLGVCGVRLFWVEFVFPADPTFANIMLVYPVSLGITCFLILGALLWCRPSRMAARRVA